MMRMKSVLLIMLQSNILYLKEVAVNAGVRDDITKEKV